MRWKPQDWVAIIIGTGLVSWGVILMVGLTLNKKPLSESGGEIFLAIATGLVAVLGVYFSRRNGNDNDKPKE